MGSLSGQGQAHQGVHFSTRKWKHAVKYNSWLVKCQAGEELLNRHLNRPTVMNVTSAKKTVEKWMNESLFTCPSPTKNYSKYILT